MQRNVRRHLSQEEHIMKRHVRDNYYVLGEGILTYDSKHQPVCDRASTEAALRKFRFSRMGLKGKTLNEALRTAIAEAMTASGRQTDSANPAIPAGYTFLGQFNDHDLSFDNTAMSLGTSITVEELKQGRSPALDLDCVYGRGPQNPEDAKFYHDGIRLKLGKTAATPDPDTRTNQDLDGFDLPRVALGSKKVEQRAALIPDHRNDENLAVGQTHLAFIRFHNRVVNTLANTGTPSADLYNTARALVVKHYQWMIRTDFLPRIVDKTIVVDVFTNGRQFFEVHPQQANMRIYSPYMCLQEGAMPTIPIEFSIAAYRLGHSMVRGATLLPIELNLAFRNLTRAGMVELATGQQMAGMMGTTPLTATEILDGNDGAVLAGLSQVQKDALTTDTPLWFYILREAEVKGGGQLTGVGGRIVAEVFHRAMQASQVSILRDPAWRPFFGPPGAVNTFRMVDRRIFACEGKAELLNPLGD
jgi:Animal haem peroxidase